MVGRLIARPNFSGSNSLAIDSLLEREGPSVPRKIESFERRFGSGCGSGSGNISIADHS